MYFGGDDDDPGDVDDYHRAMIQDWFNHNVTHKDLERELNRVGEAEGEFWSDFKERYEPFLTDDGSNGDAFLAEIGGAVPHEPGVYFNLQRDPVPPKPGQPTQPAPIQPEVVPGRPVQLDGGRGGGTPVQPSHVPTPQKTPDAQPAVPRPGRGRDHAPRRQNAVVRVARRVGRFFGIGRNK